jgi:hypothetical protein
MEWNDCRGAYHAFISLGSTCQTAYQLKRLKLRTFSGPLDWFTSRSVPHVARLIRNRFRGLMKYDHLRVLGMDETNYIIQDHDYDVVSYHDFPLPYRWTDRYPDFKQKIDRRANALLSVTKRGPVCFIRTDTSKAEAKQLYAALRSTLYGKFRLLIVNNSAVQGVKHEDWGLPQISSVSVPHGIDWRGSDLAWDQIMDGFRLTIAPTHRLTGHR